MFRNVIIEQTCYTIGDRKEKEYKIMKSKEAGIQQKSNIFFATPSMRAKNLFYYVTCVGHFYYEDTYNLERENYNSLLILYVLNGNGKANCYHKTFSLKKDDIVLFNCYDWHGYSAQKNLETLWVHFDGLNSRSLFESLYEQYGCIMKVKDPFIVLTYLKKIYSMHEKGEWISEALQSAYLTRILAEFFCFEEAAEKRENSFIEKGIEYIRKHLSESITIKEVADYVSLSEFYFSRCFKKETGFTPYEYITNLRINQAKLLLKNSEKSLYEIAVSCGFSNEGNFIRTFKKCTDFTPGMFRKMIL